MCTLKLFVIKLTLWNLLDPALSFVLSLSTEMSRVQATGFENWSYTVENVDGALQVREI